MNAKRAADKLLAASGFVDIEKPDGSFVNAGKRGEGRYTHPKLGDAEYMELAGQWLHAHRFETTEQREVWAMHAEGVPYARISSLMGWGPTDKARVHNVLKPIREAMLAALRPKRGGGRPAKPDGRNGHCVRVHQRLNFRETHALFMLADGSGLGLAETARRAFMLVARLVMEDKLPVSVLKDASLGKID